MSQENAITVTSKATVSLGKVVAGVQKAVEELNSVATTHGEMLENVAEAQQTLDQIQADTEIAVRKAAVELELQVAENANGVLSNLLDARGLVSIPSEELDSLRVDAVQGNRKLDAEITKAVNSALANERSQVALKEATESKEDAVIAARTQAKIESLEAQLAASQREVEGLTKQLDAERDAGIKRAEASGAMTINTSAK